MPYLHAMVAGIVFFPLIGGTLVGLLNKKLSRSAAHWITNIFVAGSFFFSVYILFQMIWGGLMPFTTPLYTWGESAGIHFEVGFLIDRLSTLLMVVVTFVSWMVHIYTIGYMQDDPGYQRFFSYISLFTFGMLMLVMANNFLQLYFGWEMVGLMSYLLIGFWFERESAIQANLKAFIVNRVGDFGFLIGIAGVLFAFNSLDYQTVFQSAGSAGKENLIPLGGFSLPVITIICMGLLIGAMGKSAQIPLHVWLPDSMEGPTPISALIHAATMVTAGIFMIARLSPLFEHSEFTLNSILVIGSLTCFLMGLVGIVQTDIKRIIAYSTLSQLGYMMMSLGASAYAIGIFHLMTHAFFKALLFLGAGSVIIALHHEQDIWKMGNLKKYMPITYATMVIGSLAIIGFPFFSGFYSKDLIIESLALSKLKAAPFAYIIALLTVFITALYSFRLLFVVFHTQERMPEQYREHLHESRPVVWIPLVILAIGSIVVGFIFLKPLGDSASQYFFGEAIRVLPAHEVVAKIFEEPKANNPIWMGFHGFLVFPFWLAVLGVFVAWVAYVRKPELPDLVAERFSRVYRVLKDKYGFDTFYNWVIAGGIRDLGKFLWRFGDVKVIDGIAVNGSARAVGEASTVVGEFQTGYLYHYAFVMITGFIILVIWLLIS